MVGYAIIPDLMEETGVGDFVKGFAEVEHEGICLVFDIDGSGPVINATDGFSLTCQLLLESMLVLQYRMFCSSRCRHNWLHTTFSMVLHKIQVSLTGL